MELKKLLLKNGKFYLEDKLVDAEIISVDSVRGGNEPFEDEIIESRPKEANAYYIGFRYVISTIDGGMNIWNASYPIVYLKAKI